MFRFLILLLIFSAYTKAEESSSAKVSEQTPIQVYSVAPNQKILVAPISSNKGFFVQIGIGKLFYFLNSYPRLSYQNFQSNNTIIQMLSSGVGFHFSRISFEYSPYYNTYKLRYPTDIHSNIKLYSHEIAAKLYFSSKGSSVRPFIGALMALQVREYQSDVEVWNERVDRMRLHSTELNRNIFSWQGRKSQVLQAGMSAGLDFYLNRHWVVGGEVRGFVSMYDLEDQWNQRQISYYYQAFPESPAPEDWSWYRLQLYLRYIF